MPGFSGITGLESIMFADNVSFDGTKRGGALTTDGQLLIGSTAAPHIKVGTLTSTDSSVTITPGSGTINLAASPGFLWSDIGASGTLVKGNGYICTGGAALSFSLPAVSAVGDVVALSLDGSTSWTITQAANQQIRFGSSQTTLGVGGSLASTAQGDTITMVCSVANTKWNVISSIGNITIV